MADNDEDVFPPLSLSNDELVFLFAWPIAAKSSVPSNTVTVAFFSLNKLNMDLIAASVYVLQPDKNGCLKQNKKQLTLNALC